MQDFLSKIDKKQYKFLAVISLIMADMFSVFYLQIKKDTVVDAYIKKVMEMQGTDVANLSPDLLEAMRSVVINTVAVMLLLFLLFNLFNYIAYFKEKTFSKRYVLFLCYTGIVLNLMVVIEGIKDFSLVQILNIFSIPIYIFVIQGHKKFFPKIVEPQS